jgi:thiamine-phosphate pyrophosphorylase
VDAAISGGASAVQVRDPDATGRELHELVAWLAQHLAGSGVPLIVNDRADVALSAGADGVHLGQFDLPVPAVRAMAGPNFVIGLSVTSIDQLDEVKAWSVGTVDYIGAGPVFQTLTKPDAAPPMGTDGLRAIASASPVPCVAIGGITEADVEAVMATGVSGIAVVSAICAADDPERTARRICEAMSR